MSAILGSGETPVKAGMIPADNAFPIPITFQDARGTMTGVVVGGLSKRQELAARFMATFAVRLAEYREQSFGGKQTGLGVGLPYQDDVIEHCVELADALLAATEPKPNG